MGLEFIGFTKRGPKKTKQNKKPCVTKVHQVDCDTNYIKLKKVFALQKEYTYLSNNLAYFESLGRSPSPFKTTKTPLSHATQ
jgi:hypothetical protein